MKPINVAAILLPALAMLTGCSTAPVQPAKAPETAQAEEEDFDVVLPYSSMQPEGSYVMDWEPTPEPPKKEVKALKTRATPQLVAPKKSKGRLFVLPTKFEH